MVQTEVYLKASTPEEIETWLDNSVQPNTGKVYLGNWMGFYEWLQVSGPMSLRGLTPGELVRKQKALNRAFVLDEIMLPEKKVILYAVLDYVNHGDNAKWRSSYKKKIHSTVRSFFAYYLGKEGFPALNGGEKNRLKGSPKTRKELKIETVKTIIDNSNAMYKAVWSSMSLSVLKAIPSLMAATAASVVLLAGARAPNWLRSIALILSQVVLGTTFLSDRDYIPPALIGLT